MSSEWKMSTSIIELDKIKGTIWLWNFFNEILLFLLVISVWLVLLSFLKINMLTSTTSEETWKQRKFFMTTFFLTFWFMQIVEWKSDGGANLAGVICYIFGLLIWVTTLPPVRKRYFELFFYTHQLYVLFVIFLALHIGDTNFSKVFGGIFLFMLDRFLRFCQSRMTVNIISMKSLPCGTVKLVLSKPGSETSSTICRFILFPSWPKILERPLWLCRPAVQCPQFHLPTSAGNILAAMASFQCFIKSIGW